MKRKYSILLIALYTFAIVFALVHWIIFRLRGDVFIIDTSTIVMTIIGWLILFAFRYRSEKFNERDN